ncbi:MAG: hypothetical protein KF699_04835 [Phycisphaeraceae bacterium]|nr:hypothetical protein [Phycisphaeraceae bacterium]
MPDTPPEPAPAPAPPGHDALMDALAQTRAELARVREHLAAAPRSTPPTPPTTPTSPTPSGAMSPRPRDEHAAQVASNAAAAAARTGDRRSVMTYLRLRRDVGRGIAP